MISGPIRIHPAALEEAEVAVIWYGSRSRRAAGLFLDELDFAIAQIESHPELYPAFDFGTQRCLLRRFPYSLIFRDHGAGIEVIAVAHGRRRPAYWRDRLE